MTKTNIVYSVATVATDNYSAAIDGATIFSLSGVASFSDSAAAGTISIQVSNDVPPAGMLAPFVPTNWVTSPNSDASKTVAAGAASVVQSINSCYRWYRFHWAKTGGAGTVSIAMYANGA